MAEVLQDGCTQCAHQREVDKGGSDPLHEYPPRLKVLFGNANEFARIQMRSTCRPRMGGLGDYDIVALVGQDQRTARIV